MEEIKNISDQLDGYMGDVYGKIEKFRQGRGITKDQAIEITKIAVEDMKSDMLWKRLKQLNEQLEKINYNIENLIEIQEGK